MKLTKKEIEFLKSREGKRFFASITEGMTKHQRNKLKERLIKPPGNVMKYLRWINLVKSGVNEKDCEVEEKG